MNLRTFTLCAALLGAAMLLLVATPSIGWAQQMPQLSALTSPQVKEYGRPGYPKMTLYVWGDADTGVWSVEEGTDLLEFVSVISRVQFGNRGPDRRTVQRLSLYRENRTDGEPFFEVRVEDLFTQRSNYPPLQNGDIVVLETKVKGRFTWRDVREVVGTAVLFLNTYLLIERL